MGVLQNSHLSVSSLVFEMLEIPKPRLRTMSRGCFLSQRPGCIHAVNPKLFLGLLMLLAA